MGTAPTGDPSAAAREAIRRCRVLAELSEEPGCTTRTFLSPPMRDVHADLSKWMLDLGMIVRVDAAGNLRGVYPGTSPAGPRLFIGSHLDTVPGAGAFDGVLGVVLGVALIELLHGERFPFAVEVIGFSDEEGVRFGVPFIGSRAFVGDVDDSLLGRRDAGGRTIAQALADFGLDPGRVNEAMADAPALGYLEFHIEQGPVLETAGAALAVVDAIVGQTRVEAAFTGAAGHAGTTPMAARRDALAGAAEWIVAVEGRGRATPGLVATVGRIDAAPGAGNVIAGLCRTTLDVRHADDAVRSEAVKGLQRDARDIARRRGLELEWTVRLDEPSVTMDRSLVGALERAVERAGVAPRRMPSGAGHDAMIVARRMPAAMLFLRSPGGISHHQDEAVIENDVALALQAGRHFLAELAQPTA